MAEEAVAVNQSRGYSGGGRLVQKRGAYASCFTGGSQPESVWPKTGRRLLQESLVSLCRQVIVAHLERYPPEAWAVLDEEEWNDLIVLRYVRTAPREGSGGLDGTGRLAPAVPVKVLQAIETAQPHLAESTRVDNLIWKDAVEFKFKQGGLTRPRALERPWPQLVARLQEAANQLWLCTNEEKSPLSSTTAALRSHQQQRQQHSNRHHHDEPDHLGHLMAVAAASSKSELDDSGDHPGKTRAKRMHDAIQTLVEAPMSLALLKESGVGKTIRKVVKGLSMSYHHHHDDDDDEHHRQQLEQVLASWMALAACHGVDMQQHSIKDHKHIITNSQEAKSPLGDDPFKDDQEDLQLLESCHSWRQLFQVLKQREEQRRSSQGQRMREIRAHLASDRPKVVKVRPAKAQHDRILERAGGQGPLTSTASPPSHDKLARLRKEAQVQASRLVATKKAPPGSPAAFAPVSAKRKGSFGDAVAFASGSKRSSSDARHKPVTHVSLPGGKSLKVPTKVVKNGTGPRQLASKWKRL